MGKNIFLPAEIDPEAIDTNCGHKQSVFESLYEMEKWYARSIPIPNYMY